MLKHLPDWLWPVLLCELNVCEACPARGKVAGDVTQFHTLTFSYFRGPLGLAEAPLLFPRTPLPPAFSKALPVKDNGEPLWLPFSKPLIYWLTVLLRLKSA